MVHDLLTIPTDTTVLNARLRLPDAPVGLVVVVHGAFGQHQLDLSRLLSGRGDSGLAVVTAELSAGINEAVHADDRMRREAMHVIGQRLAIMTRWLRGLRATARLPMGYFACGIGAGAACAAAVACRHAVSCVASWQGRIDLVGRDLLQRVSVPTLLLVSEGNSELLVNTRMARVHLGSAHTTKILHRVEGTLDEQALLARAADYARPWLARQLHEAPAPHRMASLN